MSFIETLIEYFRLFGQGVQNFIIGLGQLLKLLPSFILFSTGMSAFLPYFLVSFFVLGVTIKICLTILGRK